MNPIEMVWNELKRTVAREVPRTKQELQDCILRFWSTQMTVRDIHRSRFQGCAGVYSHERKCDGRRPWETLQREIERQEYRILSGQVSGSRHPEESGQLCKRVNCVNCEPLKNDT